MDSCSARHNICWLFVYLVCTCFGAADVFGAEYKFESKLTVLEEFNDNVFEARENRQTDFITHVQPVFNFNYSSSLWDWNINYSPEYRFFARNTNDDQFLQNVGVLGNIRLIDNFLYLAVSDTYSRIPIGGNRASLYSNQIDQNVFTVSPYIEYKLDPRWTAKTGYRYVNRYYGNSGSTDNQEHGAFLTLTRELTSNASSFMNVDYARIYPHGFPYHDRLTHTFGGRYQYAQGSFLTAEGGYSVYFPENGNSKLSPYWNVGLKHLLDTYTFSLNSGVSYDNDSNLYASERRNVTGRIEKAYSRGVAGIYGTYSKTLNSNTSSSDSWYTTGADATYEISRRTTSRASISTDKYLNKNTFSSGDYRNSFTAGIKYELYSDLFTGLDYNRIAYSSAFFCPTGPIEVNRVTVYVTKTF